ncbi:unnamed protein product [Calypogeia fissa]
MGMDKEDEIDAEVKQQQQQHNNVLIYTETPKPIVVNAENFQSLVQSLTGGKRKRKTVTFAPVNVDEKADTLQEHSVSSVSSLSPPPPPSLEVPEQPLLDYLDRLDQECTPPPSTAFGGNRGFFATAGLVKGVRVEDGLQQFDAPDSPRTHLGPSAPNFEATDYEVKAEKELSTVCCVQFLTTITALQSRKRVCTDWEEEWTGCLSPRSGQVVKVAQKTAARWNRDGLGPWKIDLENMAESDRCGGGDDDECGYLVDLMYYKGEVTIVQAQT